MKTKHLVPVLLLAISYPLGGGLLAQSDAQLTEADRAQLLEKLAESRQQFMGLLAATSDAQWSWKPNEKRWSVGECAEHILRSNERLFGTARRALASPQNPEWQKATMGKSKFLMSVMPNRQPMGTGGATAPQEIRPTGELSRQDVVARFNVLYDEMEEMTRSTELPVKAHTAEHPFPVFSTLNAYQWMLYVPLHTIRHSRQMIEVMETEGFPSE